MERATALISIGGEMAFDIGVALKIMWSLVLPEFPHTICT